MAAATSRWRAPEDASSTSGRIGPNAILQFLPVISGALGDDAVPRLLAAAGIAKLPDGTAMIPEMQAARLHRQVRLDAPECAAGMAAEAGLRTADYILAHRIPGTAQTLLKILPAFLSAPMLARAITAHAWTFTGSGRFNARTPWCFEIAGNPLIQGERAAQPICHWHAAVFQRLYRALVAPDVTCIETRCRAQTGTGCCRFELTRQHG